MLKYLLSAVVFVCLFSPAEARPKTYAAHKDCNVIFPCEGVAPSARGERVVKAMGGFGTARKVYTPRARQNPAKYVVIRQNPPPSYSGRPAGCPARSWCGCWLASHLGISDRSLWLARNWARVGHSAGGPQVGAIVVWRHHVGKVTAVDGNRIRVLSGNDSKMVRERWRTTAGVIAYRVAG